MTQDSTSNVNLGKRLELKSQKSVELVNIFLQLLFELLIFLCGTKQHKCGTIIQISKFEKLWDWQKFSFLNLF